MKKKILLVFVVAGLHFFFTLKCWMFFAGCRLPECTSSNAILHIALFPIGSLQKYWTTLFFGITPISILICLNSLFWGIALVGAYYWVTQKAQRHRSRSKGSE